MRFHKPSRRFALVFATALASILVLFAGVLSAAPARAAIYTSQGTATCSRTGDAQPAAFQDSTIGVQFRGFWDREVVSVDITFPDGRVFSLNAAQGLDGVVDQPLNAPSGFRADLGGDLYFDYPITSKWPYGCYVFTGRGVNSRLGAQAFIVVTPGGAPAANPGLAQLSVLSNSGGQPTGVQNSLVNIYGRGFTAKEVVAVWITAPDGVVISFPEQLTSNIGAFEATFQFTAVNPVGQYHFTALGLFSNYRVIAPFTLTAPPIQEQGWALMRVAFPADRQSPQRTVFEVQGQRFSPFERIDIWMTLPDGAVRGLPSQFADQVGNFFALLTLDETLPTGLYHFTGQGAESRRLVITSFGLEQAFGAVANPNFSPEVIDSNSGAAGGPTNINNAVNNVGPVVTQSDLPPPPDFIPPAPDPEW